MLLHDGVRQRRRGGIRCLRRRGRASEGADIEGLSSQGSVITGFCITISAVGLAFCSMRVPSYRVTGSSRNRRQRPQASDDDGCGASAITADLSSAIYYRAMAATALAAATSANP